MRSVIEAQTGLSLAGLARQYDVHEGTHVALE